MDDELKTIREMHRHHGITPIPDTPQSTDVYLLTERGGFLTEEVDEFKHAVATGNFVKAFDALLDIVVVAKGTASMMGIDANLWKLGFDEVMRSQFTKIRGPGTRFKNQVDLIKPPGWQEPRLKEILDEA